MRIFQRVPLGQGSSDFQQRRSVRVMQDAHQANSCTAGRLNLRLSIGSRLSRCAETRFLCFALKLHSRLPIVFRISNMQSTSTSTESSETTEAEPTFEDLVLESPAVLLSRVVRGWGLD